MPQGGYVLGVCLGAQLLADVLGARVYANAEKEIGWFPIEMTEAATANRLFSSLPQWLEVFHWHGDTLDMPAGAVHLARSAGCAHQAFVYDERVVGLQFHPEATPGSVQSLISHCADDIAEGRYIQPPQDMLADARRFDVSTYAMHRFLDRMAAASSERATRTDRSAS